MAESVYKVIELVGTSTESWEKAAKAAVDLVTVRGSVPTPHGPLLVACDGGRTTVTAPDAITVATPTG